MKQTLNCRTEVAQLEAEKQELLKELRLAESRSNQNLDETNTDTLVVLAEAKGVGQNCVYIQITIMLTKVEWTNRSS